MTDAPDALRNTLSGRFTVKHAVGRGGMAVVYLAHDKQNDRDVAIKTIRPDVLPEHAAGRFLREVQVAAQLQHPYIVPLFESGQAGDDLFYVMPYVDGETLRTRLDREGPLPLEDARHIAGDIGEALAHAHHCGIVHRDVKPENIFLSKGHALLADFGIAHAFVEAGGDRLTGPGIAVGTPAYMSPEQAGAEERIDARADIYALGCVLYEMLAGEPPFTGTSAQAVLAKHQLERLPSLEVVRPGIPPSVIGIVRRCLEKVPADRFDSADAFLEALADFGAPARATHRPAVRRVVAGVASLSAVALAGWWILRPGTPILNENRVVVFPLVERSLSGLPEGIGETVALMIGSALEGTEPLRWYNGWIWLTPAERSDIRQVSARHFDEIARSQGARYRIDGTVLERGDSASVILLLHDVADGSIVTQHTETTVTHPDSAITTGLRAITGLLPRMLQVSVAPTSESLASSNLPAIALWTYGDREYRHSRFEQALDFYERAVGLDSTLARAALKGAQAASWRSRHSTARGLVRAALGHEDRLPERHRHFARGLLFYLDGAADSAVQRFEQALTGDEDWSDAWMALGEVYRHLLPTVTSADSAAEVAFLAAGAADPEFTPPFYHLAEFAIRRGDTPAAAELVERFRRADPDTALTAYLEIMIDCVSRGARALDWRRLAESRSRALLQAAHSLAPTEGARRCAKRMYEAILGSEAATQLRRWDALVGLQSMLLAEGNDDSVATLLDSAVAAGEFDGNVLYVVDAIAGFRFRERAARFLNPYNVDYASRNSVILWMLGTWNAFVGDTTAAQAVLDELQRRANSTGRRLDSLFAQIVSAHGMLARHDTGAAISSLESLTPSAARTPLAWSVWEPLAQERTFLADLYLAQGRYRDALRLASQFDHPAPAIYLMYRPRSLLIRAEAARGLGQERRAEAFLRRLDDLQPQTDAGRP